MKIDLDNDVADEITRLSLQESVEMLLSHPLEPRQDYLMADSMLDVLSYYSTEADYWSFVTTIGDKYVALMKEAGAFPS